MRTRICIILVAVALAAGMAGSSAAERTFSLADVLSPAYPSGLVAAKSVDRIAWIFNDRGARAPVVEDPGDAVDRLGRDQTRRIGRRQDIGQGKRPFGGGTPGHSRSQRDGDKDDADSCSHFFSW